MDDTASPRAEIFDASLPDRFFGTELRPVEAGPLLREGKNIPGLERVALGERGIEALRHWVKKIK